MFFYHVIFQISKCDRMVSSNKIFMKKVLIVQATFNPMITDKLSLDFETIMHEHNIETETIFVPGALEIPQTLARILKTKHEYLGIIGIGCVIKGDSFHFEIVCQESARGLMNVSLESPIPIINGILTCYDQEQAIQRAQSHGSKDSKETKGKEFGQAMISMLGVE